MSGVQLPETLFNGDIESAGGHNILNSAMGSDALEPIALIRLDMKFAQDAVSAESFWRLLIEGRSAMTEVPNDRSNFTAFYHSDATRTNAVNRQLLQIPPFLPQISLFQSESVTTLSFSLIWIF